MASEEEEIINLIAQELQAGRGVDDIVGELVQAGLPQNEAYTVVNAVAQQMRGRGPAGPPGGGAPAPRRGPNWLLWILLAAVLVLVWMALRR
jgi:hypothetical protein